MVVHKIKGKEEFVLVEHQSSIDYSMPERITEYCIVIINSRGLKRKKEREYPIIYPIVLSTAKKKWDASLTIVQEQKEYYGFPPLEYPKYNLVDINDYTIEELLQERTGVSLAMAFEKIKTVEEMNKITEILKTMKLNIQEKRALALILKNTGKIQKYLGEEGIKEYKKIIIKGDEKTMKNFNEFLEKLCNENYRKGKAEGKTDTIFQVVLEMLKNKVKDEDIIKYTHISKEELKKLKLQNV